MFIPDNSGGIKIVDIKDKYNPYIVQYIPIVGCNYIWITKDNRYVIIVSDFNFYWQIQNPANIKLFSFSFLSSLISSISLYAKEIILNPFNAYY